MVWKIVNYTMKADIENTKNMIDGLPNDKNNKSNNDRRIMYRLDSRDGTLEQHFEHCVVSKYVPVYNPMYFDSNSTSSDYDNYMNRNRQYEDEHICCLGEPYESYTLRLYSSHQASSIWKFTNLYVEDTTTDPECQCDDDDDNHVVTITTLQPESYTTAARIIHIKFHIMP